MDDPAGPRASADMRVQRYLEDLRVLRFCFEDTGNPLFVWDALAVLNNLRLLADAGVAVPPMPLVPDWAGEYLQSVGARLSKMAPDETVHTSRALKLVPACLGLAWTKGTSAFRHYRSVCHLLAVADVAAFLREGGAKGDGVLKGLQKARGADREASVVRKALSKGRRVRRALDSVRQSAED